MEEEVLADRIQSEYVRWKKMTEAEEKVEFRDGEAGKLELGSRELWPNVGRDIAQALKECGVNHAFGAVGGRTWQIVDELSRAGIRVITFGHEQAAVYAADAYTQLWRGQKAAAVFASISANLYSAVQEDFLTSSPIVLLTVGTELEHDKLLNTLQDSYSYRFMETITKWSCRVFIPWTARQFVTRAVKKSLAKPTGPVNIEFSATALFTKREILRDTYGGIVTYPGDWKSELFLSSWRPQWRYEDTDKPLENGSGSPDQIRKAAESLAEAKKAYVLIGEWASWEECDEEAREFIEYWSLPFNTRRIGRAVVSERHPNCSRGNPRRTEYDLLVTIGVKIGFFDDYAAWWPPAVQFADSEARCYNYVKTKAAVIGSLKYSLKDVVEYAKAHGLGPAPEQKEWLKELREEQQVGIERRKERAYYFGPDHPRYKEKPILHFGYCAQIIREICDEDWDGKVRIMIDGYSMSDYAMPYCIHTRPTSCITANDQAGVGHGIGLAIGTALADRERKQEEAPVLALMGDSGMLNSGFDIEVAVRERLPIVYWISNNGGWMPGMKYPWYGPNWDTLGRHNVMGSRFKGIVQMGEERPLLRFEKLADVIGAVGMVCEWEYEFKDKLREAMEIAWERKIPVVFNCIMDSHLVNRAVCSPVYTLMYAHIPFDELPARGKAARKYWFSKWLPGLEEEPAVSFSPGFWNYEPESEEELGYKSRMEYFDETSGYEGSHVEEWRKAGITRPPLDEVPPVLE